MSKTIDERVVEMRFDNKQFESNVQTSMKTIENLKKSLNMDGATKGLESVDAAAKKIDMSGLGSAVETVKTRFSALEVMAVTALANITSSVINTGKQMLHSLTIAPIKDGFEEYEMTLNSIQTTMSGTGKTAKEVESELKKLDEYADKTVYSSADMFNNLPKFTNAGVELEQATTAMIGIANATALAGGDARQASIAFYNLGQAIGTGYLTRMDYNSINNAGMATMEWKEQMVEAALAAGTLTKSEDGLYKAGKKTFTLQQLFIDGLQEQWATTEVMMKVFQDYGDETTKIGKKAYSAAQDLRTFSMMMDSLKATAGTGWKDTWQILFGDLDEAKGLWTDLGNVIDGFIRTQAKVRNEMLQTWKDLGGRTELIEVAKNAFEGLKSVITPIVEAFREIFPATTGEQLYNLTKSIRDFTENLKLSDTASANLKSSFKGLFAILDIVKQAFSAILTAVKPLFGGFDDLGGGILGVTGNIGDAIVAFDEFIKSSGAFQKVGEGIAKVIQIIMNAFTNLKNKIKEKIESANFEVLHNLLERIHTRMEQVKDAAGNMRSGVVVAIEAIGDALEKCEFLQLMTAVWDAVKKIGTGLVKILSKLGKSITSSLGEANFSGIIDLLNGLSFGAIAVGITKFVKGFSDAMKEVGSIKESFVGILDSVKGCLEAYQTQLKAGTLLKIASAIAILAASIIAISLIDSDKLNASLGAMTVLFADLMVSMAVFNKLSGKASGVTKSITAMLGIATAVLILAGALKKIGDMNAKELTTGLVGVAALTAMMVASAKVMGSGGKTIVKGATQMVIFAAAIKVLASACNDLSSLDWNELAKGLVGVGVLLAEVSLFMRTAKFSGKSITTATGIVILSAAIKVLASACKDFGAMKWEEIGKGLAAIGVLLTEITLFTKLTGNAKHVISTGVALIAIGAAMKILASAVGDFGNMQWDEIGRGLTVMAGALAAITLAVNFMPKNMVSIGTGLIAVSAALLIIANALEHMSGFTWEEIGKGMVTLGGAMAILAIGLNVMTGTLAGSAALLVAASALLVLTPVLAILGAMSWESIAKGLVTLAGTFTVLGVAGLVLTPLVPTILALSGSLALIGVAVVGIGAGLALAGAGLSALAVGLTALAAAGTAGATAIVASLTVIITGVAELIPAVVAKLGEAIVEFCRVIVESSDAIGEAVKSVVLMLVDVLVECVPAIADGALKLLAGVLEALVEYTPSIVDSVFQFLIEVLEGVARNLPGLIQAAVDVLMAFFSGIVDALKGIDTETLLQGIVGIGLLSAIMVALSAVAALVPGAMVGVLGMGAVIAELALVLAAVGALAQIPGLNWLINEGGNLLEGIGTAIGKFVGGIVGGFMSGVSSQFPQIGSDLSGFMTNVRPFLDGASSIDPTMMDGVKALAETILILTAANILEGITSWLTGGSSLTGFAEEMVPFGKAMKQFSEEVSGIDNETVANAAIAGKTLAEMAATLPNTGGVVGFFTGENDMNAFGEQLIPFGRAMKAFADEVAGLDAKVITEAATAGKAMTEMAATIPNSRGVVGFFTGENDMDVFGEQLVPFGRAMKQYGIAVSGLNADVIQNSVTAGEALLELANTVPNAGGVVSWFTGDNDLETFGEQVVPFGRAMKSYSIAVSGLDAKVVANSANAAKALVELADNLPNTGGVVSWFTGDNSIAGFGESLASFGKSFASYYSSVSSVNVVKLNGVAAEFSTLVDLAKGVENVDTSGLSNFGKNLGEMGKSGINEFINGFTNANSRITSTANTMITTFINAVNAKKASMTSAFTSIVSSCSTAIKNKYNAFYNAGKYLVKGFANGITDYTWYAEAKAKAMAKAAADAAKEELDINSPSKVGYEIGGFFGLGFVNAIADYSDNSYDAGTSIAASAKEGLSNAVGKISEYISDGIDAEPMIRPILDLSQVQAGAGKLSALLSRTHAMKISGDMASQAVPTIQNGESAPVSGNSYNFTQNNYSPKSLSRVEIYRQTKNQFSAMERMVEA